MALNYVTVTGTFDDGSGSPLPAVGQSAYCLFTPSTAVYASGVPLITPAQPIQAPISSGALSQRLLATDNAGLTFGGLTGFFYWTVTLVIAGQTQPSWSFFLPSSPATVDLSKLANTAAGGGGATLPLTTLGDLLYENATPAPARLPGNTTAARQFLTQTGTGSVSAAPAWGAIAAGDVPTLNQDTTGKSAKTDALNSATTIVNVAAAAAPTVGQALIATGPTAATWQTLPPGVQVLTFTFGPTGAIPSSGTFTAGTAAVDQNSILRICTASGTPGTWQRAGSQPYQFFVDDYGAKGDGRQALVTTVAGSAVINTTPIGAPAAPTVSNAATGGTIAAGIYKVEVTYVNQYGETVASGSTTTTTSGSTSTITINSPAGWMNATGWYAYVTQAGGNTYTRQQTAGSPTAIGVALILAAPPSSSGANPPGSDTSAAQIFTSTAVDGGKNIMINGGLGSPGTPWIDTIASVQSATQATLNSNGAGQGGNVSQAGCAAVFSSDDRTAIDNCIQAATAYAVANNYFFQAIFSGKAYGVGTGLFQSTAPNASSNPATIAYNAQVRIPVPAAVASGQTPKLEAQLIGPGDNGHAWFWVSALPNLNGASLVSYSVGPNSPDPTYGQQSVIGGPAGGTSYNGSNGFANVAAIIKGIQVVQPGWCNSIGIDLNFVSGFRLNGSSMAYAPTTNTGGGVNPSSGWGTNSFYQAKIGAGLRTAGAGNNDDCIIESFASEGLTVGVITQGEHLEINRLLTINNYFGIRVPGGMGLHSLTIAQWSAESILGGIFQVVGGSNCQVNIVFDGENGGPLYDIQDNGNHLLGVFYWYDGFRSPSVPTIQGAANLKVVNTMAGLGHMAAPPAVPATTVAAAPVYKDAWVTVHTGAGVTVSAITIDGTATGLTMAASSTLAVLVPSGKTIALTYAGGTPTWDWWLS